MLYWNPPTLSDLLRPASAWNLHRTLVDEIVTGHPILASEQQIRTYRVSCFQPPSWRQDATIFLFGIAVMNGVVLIEHIRALRESGGNMQEAVFSGAVDRVRPVLMRATTDALGFLPMAFSTSSGAEVQRPLATVVIGGVITSSLLTLIVLPSIYKWFEPKNEINEDVNEEENE
ncbi:Cobalt-zinc-cadmium resistance protein CzcA [Novipirellula aureliae]|uniref:Cobalt-zinc-cadmium resistance protein CzcA n=2 Tax=Novipirellula aureliae TaxID=2527966 RepID=A0A5C6DT06_9BACT|nr:Cobalt-zinc-cadmium resistance protein CzcA [Novipirellula aureliae]